MHKNTAHHKEIFFGHLWKYDFSLKGVAKKFFLCEIYEKDVISITPNLYVLVVTLIFLKFLMSIVKANIYKF